MDNTLKGLLAKYGFTLKKSLGQNFLSDNAVLDAIIEKGGITAEDVVLEIGCGAGTLTEKLALSAKRVIGYEIDRSLEKLLSDRLSPYENAEIVYKDVMKIKTAKLEKEIGGKYKVVANLPYYITTPILMKFVEEADNVDSMSVMMQKEVALRLTAKAGTSDYGAITAAINAVGEAHIIEEVGREKFLPPPNVDSAVVRIDFDRNKFGEYDRSAFRAALKCAFSNRRKTLSNNLMSTYKISRAEADAIITDLGYATNIRGEILDTQAFFRLSQLLVDKKLI